MKQKIVSAILLLSILMVGCGSGEPGSLETTEVSGEFGAVEQDIETEDNFASSAELEQVEDTFTESASDKEAEAELVEYSYENLYLSVEIPDGWEYKIRSAEELAMEDGLVTCAIEFWPTEFPDAVFELGYQTTMLGLCLTGVTVEEFTLSNGLSGYRYTEEIDDVLWMNITISSPQNNISGGTYLISASPELTAWDAVKTEFEQILESVWVGPRTDNFVEEGSDAPFFFNAASRLLFHTKLRLYRFFRMGYPARQDYLHFPD